MKLCQCLVFECHLESLATTESIDYHVIWYRYMSLNPLRSLKHGYELNACHECASMLAIWDAFQSLGFKT